MSCRANHRRNLTRTSARQRCGLTARSWKVQSTVKLTATSPPLLPDPTRRKASRPGATLRRARSRMLSTLGSQASFSRLGMHSRALPRPRAVQQQPELRVSVEARRQAGGGWADDGPARWCLGLGLRRRQRRPSTSETARGRTRRGSVTFPSRPDHRAPWSPCPVVSRAPSRHRNAQSEVVAVS
jgi:hypothetical protein